MPWYKVLTPKGVKHKGQVHKDRVEMTPGEAALLQRQGTLGEEVSAPEKPAKPAPAKADKPATGGDKPTEKGGK